MSISMYLCTCKHMINNKRWDGAVERFEWDNRDDKMREENNIEGFFENS